MINSRDRGKWADALGGRLLLALTVAAAALSYGWLDNPVVGLSVLIAAIGSVAAFAIDLRRTHRDPRRRDVTPYLRGAAAISLCALGFFWPVPDDNVWLIGAAAVLVEAVVVSTMKQVVAVVGGALAVAGAAYLATIAARPEGGHRGGGAVGRGGHGRGPLGLPLARGRSRGQRAAASSGPPVLLRARGER